MSLSFSVAAAVAVVTVAVDGACCRSRCAGVSAAAFAIVDEN